MKMSRVVARSIALSTAAAAAVTVAAPAASATTLNYVSMGDSYSAGSGLLPLAPGSNPLCTQAANNAAHVIAARRGFNLKDVSCGLAKTADFEGKQFGFVTPQLAALSADTDVITLTIGGNDSDVFLNSVLACASSGFLTNGSGSPCKTLYGDKFKNTVLNKTYPAVLATLQSIKAKAPNARIAIAGYPRILPETGGCYAKTPIAAGDVPYLNDLEITLNSVVQRAAAETNVTYVDMWTPSAGRDSCQPVGTRWVEPLLFGSNYVPVHPNALGEAAYADRYLTALGL